MKRLFIWLGLMALVLPAAAQFPGASDPFTLTPSLVRSDDGSVELRVDVAIPAEHILYTSDTGVAAVDSTQLVMLSDLARITKRDPFQDTDVEVYATSGTLIYSVSPPSDTVSIKLSHWGCSDTECFFPIARELVVSITGTVPVAGEVAAVTAPEPQAPSRDALVFAGRAGGFLDAEAMSVFLDSIDSGEAVAQDAAQRILSRYGVPVLVLALLGFGFLLNLTPCVLPMIPVNIAIIGAGAQAGSRTRGLLLGATYGLGMALTYGALGVLVVMTGSRFQFGTLNSSPWFNAVIAVVFLVLSLGMFGVYEMDLSRFQKVGPPGRGKDRGPVLTALAMGSIAALLAGACVAPVLISVLVMATDMASKGNHAGLLLPFVLGLGMALPWPIVGAGFSILPKPGNWMVRVRAGFGVIILAAALFYAITAGRIWSGGAGAAQDDGFWLRDLDQALAVAVAEDKPVFVDLWASWCKNCTKMDKTTFKDADVLARLADYVPVKLQAEDLKDPETRKLLELLGVEGGLPHVVVIEPPGR